MISKRTQLRDISQVRSLQLAAAEVAAGRAIQRLDRLREECARAEQRLTDILQAWARHMQGSSLDLTLAGAWAESVGSAEQSLAFIKDEISQAEVQADHARGQWKLGSVRSENAQLQFRRSEKEAQRQAEERAQLTASDLWPHLERGA